MPVNTISIADYILKRLVELGIEEVFGVPGDYNLALLDRVMACDKLHWVGNCNELNAAYAADGYARIRGTAALITTFGVGELSALNGIAGSFAEYLPVVNLVGWPATTAQKEGMLMHHTLGTGDFGVFLDMFKKVSSAVAILDTPEHAAVAIDEALEIGWVKKQPIYIGLPSNHVDIQIQPPQHKLNLHYPKSDPHVVDELVSRAAGLIRDAKNPVILADLCAVRHPMKPMIQTLLTETGLPLATMNMGKGIFDESHPNFLGGYDGDYSTPGVQARVEGADCIIAFGFMLSDFNTGGFTCDLSANASIEVHSNHVKIKHALYPDVYFDAVIPALIKALRGYQHSEIIKLQTLPDYQPSSGLVTQQRFWDRMAHYVEAGDMIVAETGTSMFGLLGTPILKPATIITQPLWASIGYTVGAVLGAALADRSRRALLFVGDGSFQLTAQEVSTMVRHKLTPVIFLLNNDGYTIERVIHGRTQAYNDVHAWDYAAFSQVFGGNVRTLVVKTELELEKALSDANVHRDALCFIELKLTRDDCPENLRKLGEACDAKNKG